MKKVLLLTGALLLVVAGAMFVASCSSDDDELSNRDDVVTVKLSIRANNGEYSSLIREGEDVEFLLTIENHSNNDIWLPAPSELVGNQFFTIYSSDGKEVDKPWDILFVNFITSTNIKGKGQVTYSCSWLEGQSKSSHLTFVKEHERLPLPKGDYYTEFTVNLGDYGIRKCKQSFKIE